MTTTFHPETVFKIINRHGIVNVYLNTATNHHSLHAATSFNTGDIILHFYAATTQTYPTYLTIQTGHDKHITLEPAFLQYINHSCDPNVFFDTTAMQLICVNPVQTGDELRFFYPSAEWTMAQPFVCNCQSKNCLQFVNGAAHLSETTLRKYQLTDFILKQIEQNR